MKSYESRGYDIFDFDGTGMLEIEKIDEINMFDSDEDAVKQAIKDGIKIIPVEELPENFICPLCKHPASDFEEITE